MKKTSETIIFFGSGPVASKSLELLAGDFEIEAVITKPRPPHHKGDVPVLSSAEKLKLSVHTAQNKDELDKLFSEKRFKSRLAILIDFGIIVSQKVIDYFPLGIINSHFSLLPEWRGADPITFSVLSGQKTTGVSLMLLTAGMDEGPLLTQTRFDIPPTMTTPELTEALIEQSYEALCWKVPGYIAGEVTPAPQPDMTPTYSRRLTKEDGTIDWAKPADVIEREIRAYTGWPKSRTSFGELEVVVAKAHVIDATGPAGTTTVIDKLPVVFCGAKALALDYVKPANKKEMPGQAFLAGYKKIFVG